MLTSCRYCGRVHDSRYDCGRKPRQARRIKEAEAGRYTGLWKAKAIERKEAALWLCQVCLEAGDYTTGDLEAHHIVPLLEGGALLDDENIIVLCKKHHRDAENGLISRDFLRDILRKQNKISPPGPAIL